MTLAKLANVATFLKFHAGTEKLFSDFRLPLVEQPIKFFLRPMCFLNH